jgi:RNA polymerase sigma-70 factor, ECF subfamily
VLAEQLADRQTRFDALVLPHLDRLFAFAMRRTAVRADAEDAVQDACVRAWLAFDELRDAARARAWIYRILRGVLAEAGERVARRRQLVDITRLDNEHDAVVGGGADVLFDEVAARMTGEEIRNALAQLPDDFAIAVELHDMDGFKYQEIAEIIGVPIGTVMSRISRGRRLLAGAVLASRTTQPGSAQRRGPSGGAPR